MERKRTVWTALALLGLLVVAVIGVSLLISMTLDSGWLGGEKVGVIRIEGVITDSRETIEELRRFRDNPSIKAVVLRIDSPGGGGVALPEEQVEQVRDLADGRIFTGRQARTAKLVDELGDLQDSIKLAARLVGIEGEPRVVEPRKRFSFRDLLDSFFWGQGAQLVPSRINLKYLLSLYEENP